MKTNYQGMSADASIGTSEHGGGDQYRFNADVGYGDLDTDKYNVYADFEYQLDKRIRIDQRGFLFNTNDLTSIPGGQNNNPQAGGSTVYGNVKPAIPTEAGNLASGQAIGGLGNEWRPLRACAPDAPADRRPRAWTTPPAPRSAATALVNIATFGDVQPKQERIGTYGRFTIKPNDNLEAYLSGSFVQSKTSVTGTPVTISSQHAA